MRYGNYVVITSRARMPAGGCYREYMHVAVMKTATPQINPNKIADCIRYWPVKVWRRVFKGKTNHCAYMRALDAADKLARELFLAGN